MRHLATIRTIKDKRPIPGADKIEVVQVDGWECVVSKDDGFKIGDNVVYIEIDSIVPERPEFEFLRGRKFRVRTIKLRGQISQGLVLNTKILPLRKAPYEPGEDVTDILGIKKYDPQAEQEKELLNTYKTRVSFKYPEFLMRFKWFRKLVLKPKKSAFPEWIKKTNEERVQNLTGLFERERDLGTEFSATEKIDGQSGTYFVERVKKKKLVFGVCSRNIRLSAPDNSSYWSVARQFNIENVLKDIAGSQYHTVVLQGEIIGGRIQGNKYKINGYDFYAFNLIIDGRKLHTKTMERILRPYGIKCVPTVEASFSLKETIQDMVNFAKGKSVILPSQNREGLVVRNYDKGISFKVINPDFLLAEGG